MANTLKMPGVTLGTSKAALITCAAGTQIAVTDLVLFNGTSSARTASLFVYTAADATERPGPANITLSGNANHYRFPAKIFLQPGDEIRAFADTASAVVATISHTVLSAATPVAKGFTSRGIYSGSATYATNDVVSYAGGSYASMQDGNTGRQPDTSPTYWTLLAAQGPAGLAQGRYSRVVFLTTSQTWTAPANVRGRVTVIGAGGSGGAAVNSGLNVASGGAAGGIAYKALTASSGAAFTATVGAGGSGVSTGGGTVNGNAGGASSFTGTGISVTANGGAGGVAAAGAVGTARTAAGAAGGVATGGDLNYTGGGSGTATIGAGLTAGNAAATGGGSVSFFGSTYASGTATISGSSGSSGAVASGGAGVGGNSADTATSTAAPTVSGGGSGSGPSLASTGQANGGPDIFGGYGDSYWQIGLGGSPSYGALPATAFTIFDFSGRGGSASTTGASQIGDAGCGGGAGAVVNNGASAGGGGLFAGGGGAACTTGGATGGAGGYQRNPQSTRFGGGGGGAANSNGSAAASGGGGTGLIIIEYDLVP